MRAEARGGSRTDARGGLLGDRYELQSVIARGGMGRVWRAYDTLLERPVAVKVLRSEFTGDPTFLTRFRTEARHAALLSDPNVAAVHDYGESTDADGEHIAYLVMELVAGDPLSTVLRRALGVDVARALSIVRQTASALAAAHAAGVVHRDVKPANVLVTPDGVVKLTDFGIAWSAANVALTRTGQVMGTAHYLAPEQVEGLKATATSDVYSLGVVAYECLAGRRPFEGENSVQTALRHIRETPPPLPPDIPDDVRRLVEHAMARNPADRLPDGAALRDAVDALLAARGTDPAEQPATLVLDLPGQPSGPAERDVREPDGGVPDTEAVGAPGRRRRLRPVVAAVAGGAGLLALVLVVVGVVTRSADVPANAAPPPAPPSATVSAPATPTTFRLAAEDLVGRPVAEVQARLTALGLQVSLRPAETADAPADQVLGLDPMGEVAPGQGVTVTYAVAPAPPPTSTAPPSTAAPASATAEPTTATSTRGEGRGNRGRGNGRGNDD